MVSESVSEIFKKMKMTDQAIFYHVYFGYLEVAGTFFYNLGGHAHDATNLNGASSSNTASGASDRIMQPVDGKNSVLFEEQNRHIAILVKELDEARSLNQTVGIFHSN